MFVIIIAKNITKFGHSKCWTLIYSYALIAARPWGKMNSWTRTIKQHTQEGKQVAGRVAAFQLTLRLEVLTKEKKDLCFRPCILEQQSNQFYIRYLKVGDWEVPPLRHYFWTMLIFCTGRKNLWFIGGVLISLSVSVSVCLCLSSVRLSVCLFLSLSQPLHFASLFF